MITLIVALIIYLMPYIVADLRQTHNRNGVLVINLFLGWTVIGWLVAFFMACGSRSE